MASLTARAATVEFTGKEGWPDNACLFEPDEARQISMPDFAQCLSVKAYLNMCALPFRTVSKVNAENMSPSGKVPLIQVGPMIVSEFDPIVEFVEAKGHRLSEQLPESQRAEMKAYITLIENIIVNAELYICWCEEPVADGVTKPRHGSVHPWPLNRIIPYWKQSAVREQLKTTGWLKKTLPEVLDEVKTCCEALSEKLGKQNFFFGDKPTELDAIVYGHLFTIITTPLPIAEFAEIVNSFTNLANFCRYVDTEYFLKRRNATARDATAGDVTADVTPRDATRGDVTADMIREASLDES